MGPEQSKWRVALIDSGAAGLAVRSARFARDGSGPELTQADITGHGSRLAQLWAVRAPPHHLLLGQVFDDAGPTTPAAIAAAIHWAIDEGAHLVHLSLGLRENRASVAGAVRRAVDAQVVLVASVPAQGPTIYPGRYPGVIRATGDARCEADDISVLGPSHYGACAHYPGQAGRVARGASVGAAYVSAAIMSLAPPGSSSAVVEATLAARASYHGPERRSPSDTRGDTHACD